MISVLLPTFNRPYWLMESIESVLNQDCDLELLILDNGSEAVTGDLLRQITDPRVKLFRVDKNGTVPPWLYLAERAQGEFIVFWADDDRMLPGGLKAKLDFLESHPELGMVFSQCREIDSEGRDKGRAKMGCIDEEDVVGLRTASLLTTCYIPNTSALVRSMYVPLYRECLRFEPVVDWAFWLEVASFGLGIGFLAQETIALRVHDGSGTEDARRKGEFKPAFLKVWEHWLGLGIKLTEEEWQLILMTYASFTIHAGHPVNDAVADALIVVERLKQIRWEAA